MHKAVVSSVPLKAQPVFTRSIPPLRSTLAGARFYSSQQCTNSVRKTLHKNAHNNSSRFTHLSALHPAASMHLTSSSSSSSMPARFSHIIRRRFADKASSSSSSTTTSTTTTTTTAPTKKAGGGMMDKIKTLVKQYGYTGVAVYLGISTLDLAATFVIVKAAGMDKIEKAQDWVLDNVGSYIGYKTSAEKHAEQKQRKEGEKDASNAELDNVDDAQVGAIYNKASGLWSVFVIAYGIHKLLVPFRVVATSMITPPLVKWLVKRGWIKEVAKKGAGAGVAGGVVKKP
ncbi:hypothetical protein BG004_008157 [Podila humilis]|nr:hypothetical protein BG004_008157 [Podila humilis]